MTPVQIALLVQTSIRLGAQAWLGHRQSAEAASALDAWLRYRADHPEIPVTAADIMERIAIADAVSDDFSQGVIDYAAATGQAAPFLAPKVEDVVGGLMGGKPVDLGSLIPQTPESEEDERGDEVLPEAGIVDQDLSANTEEDVEIEADPVLAPEPILKGDGFDHDD